MKASDDLQVLVRKAARALGRHGLVHAYGHCSARVDEDSFLICAPKPMGMIQPGEAGSVVPVDGPLPDGVLGEVRIHQQIYKRRPDVGGIVRSMPPRAMSLGTLRLTPKARHGFGSYFAPEVPLWDDPLLLRSDEQAVALGLQMGEAKAILMRGNGAVVAADDLVQAVVLTWYLEDACRVEMDALSLAGHGDPAIFTEDQVKVRATGAGRIFERMWDYLTEGDSE